MADKYCIIVNRIPHEYPCSIVGPFDTLQEALDESNKLDRYKWWRQVSRMDEHVPF